MHLYINGHRMEVPQSITTVVQLLDHLQLNKELAIVEVNAEILQPTERDGKKIQVDDRIEIVQFVGGG
ncbi:sulfur carrier protein ThiS [Metasolibacillus meyeri]|uniref:sulfur carrier protein ThiS n=1 Tax=Metasolibacillus meyeri TaxID=1071052 RepID=UPI000D2F7C31|nr:sulfur carrier protein ThiS [Metasolibacillus meyeri]